MAWAEDLTALAVERGPALRGYAYLLTGDRHHAEDLVQEALTRAFARPGRGTGVGFTEAYVRRAILNVYLDGYRRDRLWGRVRHLLTSPDEARPGTSRRSPDVAARTADRIDVQDALAALPPRERACVVLRFYDDLTVPVIADRLGISLGAAKRYLADGVHRLEATLGPLDDADEAVHDSSEEIQIERSPR